MTRKNESGERTGTLLDVERTPAAIEAEKYAEMLADIEAKKNLLGQQGEKVLKAMTTIKQKVLTFNDEYGFKHVFTIVEGVIKLRHSKREDA